MTTKKAHRRKKSEPEVQSVQMENEGPRIIDGQKYLTKYDLVRFDLMDTKLLSLRQARELKEREKRDAVEKFDNRIAQLIIAERQAKAEMVKLREELGAKYEVNFFDQALSFDDQTGRLVIAPAPVRKETNDAEAS
jgi:hypothetical protein